MGRAGIGIRRASLAGLVAAGCSALAASLSLAAQPAGSAHVSSHVPACVPTSSYVASVSGSGIASVEFRLDRRRVARTRRPGRGGAFSARVALPAGRAHTLAMIVRFDSGAPAQAFSRTLARCAVKIRKETSAEPPTEPFTG